MTQARINLYRNRATGDWCYAMWIDGEFDHSDEVGCEPETREADVRDALRRAVGPHYALTFERVPDVRDENGGAV